RARLHVGTDAVDATVGRSGRDALVLPDGRAAGIVRLAEPIALRPGDRFVLRRGPLTAPVGGTIVDTVPPRGISRRRQSPERVAALVAGVAGARLDLHGALASGQSLDLAPDVRAAADAAALAVTTDSGGEVPVTAARAAIAAVLRRMVAIRRDRAVDAGAQVIERLVGDGRLERHGDLVQLPGRIATGPDPAVVAAMDRLEAALATPSPPPLGEAAHAAGCPAEAIRTMEKAGRLVILEPDLAYARSTYRDLVARALRMAALEPLTPAAFRDATGTSRKYVMAILEDLDRRAILRRTPAGHVPGPRAPAATSSDPTAGR
ncbi:MAG: SelB C-terminal domain-containing protein, partial [Chloroflexota bacterium]|nr:SelB C-terminal domain-containing protein [Chloroflexota bacterium]